jgi:hypothetical protein
VALKSIAAYACGLEINPNVSKKDAEDGLRMELSGILFFCQGQLLKRRNKYHIIFTTNGPINFRSEAVLDYK